MPCFHPWVKVGRHLPLGPSEKAVLVVGHPFFTGGMETGPLSKSLYLFLCYTVRRKPSRSKCIMQLLELYKGEFN